MITIWHNPRCSKSRATLALLKERGGDIAIRLYLQDPPNEAELRAAQTALGCRAIDMMRTGEPTFRDMGLDKSAADAALIAAMAQEPKLIERPIVFSGPRAAIGRPPEAVLALL